MKKLFCLFLVLFLSSCATWSTSSVKKYGSSASYESTKVEDIILTTKDITNKKYTVIADITTSVRKTTLLNSDPTEANVNIRLKEKAAKLGADAVILVSYGKVGVGLTSWGVLEGKGRAVKFD